MVENLEKIAKRETFFKRWRASYFPFNVLAKLSDIVSCNYNRLRQKADAQKINDETDNKKDFGEY